MPWSWTAGAEISPWAVLAWPHYPCPHSYLVAHTLGRRMLYPGSVYLLQKALMPVLLQGQARLVEEVRLHLLLPCHPRDALPPS